MSETPHSSGKKTVADIWIEVQAEQKRFNRVIRYLTAALLVAAIVAGLAAFLSLAEFQNLRRSYRHQIDFSIAKSEIQNALAEAERHAMRIELIGLKEESGQNRIYANLPRETDRAIAAAKLRENLSFEELVATAMEFSKRSAAGDLRLNPSPSYLVESVLDLTRSAAITITSDEAAFMETALSEWQQPNADATQRRWRTIAATSDTSELRGYAHAALAHYHYRIATNSSPRLGWNKGCRETTELVSQAHALNVQSISLNLAAGGCLRKSGRYEEAFHSFIDALNLLAQETEQADGLDDTIPNNQLVKFRIDASHGAGTTLVPFAINLSENGGTDPENLDQISAVTSQLPERFTDLKTKIEASTSILQVSENFMLDAVKRRACETKVKWVSSLQEKIWVTSILRKKTGAKHFPWRARSTNE